MSKKRYYDEDVLRLSMACIENGLEIDIAKRVFLHCAGSKCDITQSKAKIWKNLYLDDDFPKVHKYVNKSLLFPYNATGTEFEDINCFANILKNEMDCETLELFVGFCFRSRSLNLIVVGACIAIEENILKDMAFFKLKEIELSSGNYSKRTCKLVKEIIAKFENQ